MNSNFLGKEISGVFTIPSGIIATNAKILERIANEIPEIGVLTTKSIGLEPREGNRELGRLCGGKEMSYRWNR